MKNSKKFSQSVGSKGLVVVIATLFLVLLSAPVIALQVNPDGTTGAPSATSDTTTPSSTVACTNTTDSSGNVSNAKVQACLNKNPIVTQLQTIVNFLSAAVGLVVIGTIILGGIQYTMAGDNATATGAAKKRIANGLIALAAFLFLFAFLQWLIPGGIFS